MGIASCAPFLVVVGFVGALADGFEVGGDSASSPASAETGIRKGCGALSSPVSSCFVNVAFWFIGQLTSSW